MPKQSQPRSTIVRSAKQPIAALACTDWSVARWTLAALLAVMVCLLASVAGAAVKDDAKGKSRPDFPAVTKLVHQFLAEQANYKPGDLLTREQVKPLFAVLQKHGWNVKDADEILEDLLPASDWLARELAKPTGVAFMRKISAYPGGYDRLDRMSRIKNSNGVIRELIHGAHGEKLVAFLTEDPRGDDLGKLLSGNNSKQFNEPTGRIYTAEQLLSRLKLSHEGVNTAKSKRRGK